jgi:transcriptional regulator with PAS, ATPase and Fis domain
VQNKFANQVDTPLKSATPALVVPANSTVSDAPFPPLKMHLRDQELIHIHRAIECSAGDKRKAAVLLAISLATLYRKLEGE